MFLGSLVELLCVGYKDSIPYLMVVILGLLGYALHQAHNGELRGKSFWPTTLFFVGTLAMIREKTHRDHIVIYW